MMKASLRSAFVLGLAIGCSHSGDALFDSDGVPGGAAGGGAGNVSSGGSTGAVTDPGPQGGKASGAGTAGGGAASAGKPMDDGNGGEPESNGGGGTGGTGGTGGKSDPPAEPECGNGKLEAGEECDDAGHAGDDGCDSCQVDCSHFGQGTLESEHHCYQGYDEADFEDAEADCKERGAHLVTISSAAENQVVRMLVSTSKLIGGFEDVALTEEGQGDYAWLTGEPMSYQNWADQEPDQGESRCANGGTWPGTDPDPGAGNERCYEHCMAMNGQGKWEDHRCDLVDGYVCEWEPAGQ